MKEIFHSGNPYFNEHKWKRNFHSWALKAALNIKPSRRLNNDSMKITEYIKIKELHWPDDSKNLFVFGCVFTNNIADRRMKTFLENP